MHSTAQAAAQSSALGPEHANLGSEALKLAVQHIGGGEIEMSDDDDDKGGEAGGHKDGKEGKEDNDDSSLDEQAVLFGGAGRK